MVKVKWGIIVLIQLLRNFMSCHVVFLKHIPFFSIPSTTHALIRFDLIHIDPFSKDSHSLSSQVPSTSNTPSHVLPMLPLHYTRWIRTDHSAGTNTLLFGTPKAPSSPMVHQAPSEIVDPPQRQSIRIRKSTKLLDFAYYCYYSSFTSFLGSIHCLFEPFSYKEVIIYPLWQQAMDEELSTLHKIGTWDLVPIPPGKSVVGCC